MRVWPFGFIHLHYFRAEAVRVSDRVFRMPSGEWAPWITRNWNRDALRSTACRQWPRTFIATGCASSLRSSSTSRRAAASPKRSSTSTSKTSGATLRSLEYSRRGGPTPRRRFCRCLTCRTCLSSPKSASAATVRSARCAGGWSRRRVTNAAATRSSGIWTRKLHTIACSSSAADACAQEASRSASRTLPALWSRYRRCRTLPYQLLSSKPQGCRLTANTLYHSTPLVNNEIEKHICISSFLYWILIVYSSKNQGCPQFGSECKRGPVAFKKL